ncbi:MAG TPA: tetratricopeptide repeat protein [Candidatus Krumholzibacteria bacterium]|nr:tetratricopeptide repeat protein [Candidatus Krumholzibacteria bacterium]
MNAAALALCRQARATQLAWDWNGAPALGALLVAGADAGAFLQAQLTSDVLALAPGRGHLSARLDRKGALVAWFSLHRLPDQGQPLPTYLLIMPRDGVAALAADLARFVIAEDVLLEDVTGEFDGVVVQGPAAAAAMADLDEGDVRPADGGFLVARSFTGDPGYLQLAPRGSAATATADGPAADTAWHWLRVEAGWPLTGRDLAPGERTLPQTGLEARTVSTTKGCFLGQEVVARLRTYGSVPQALRGLVFDGLPGDGLPDFPAPGSRLIDTDGTSFGTWASGALSVAWERPVALAFLGRDHRTPGTRLTVTLADGAAAEAEVVLLPFHDATDAARRARRLHERAIHLFSRGEDDRAASLLEQALGLDPGYAEAYEALGVILGRSGRYHEAIDVFRRLEQVAPDEPMVHTNLSLFYMKIGDREEAERQKAQATLKRFAGLDGERTARERAEADAAARRTDAERKLAMFGEVLAFDPDDPLALMGLGNALVTLERLAEAEPHLARACAVQKDNSAAFAAHGKVLERLGRTNDARAAYRAGVVVASRKGDLMPLREMEHRLLVLGS